MITHLPFVRHARAAFGGCVFLLTALAPLSGEAIVLDWNTVSWTRGATTQSFDIDPNNAGNDIRITLVTTSGAAFTDSNPFDTAIFTGGSDTSKESLNLRIDLASISDFVRVRVDFLYEGGVNNAQFTLFDVDRDAGNSWQDQVRYFSGTSISDSTIHPTNVTGSSGNLVTGDSLTGYTVTGMSNVVNSGAGSQNGNVNISYGQSYISSMFLDYGSGSSAQSNPGGQGIGIGNISFTPTPTPEINPGLGAAIACVGAVLVGRRRRNGSAARLA